jgi:AraC-like DNA-binding protein
MLHEQRHRMYRQRVFTPAAAPAASAGAWLAVLGRLRGTGCFDLEQRPRAPSLHVVQDGAGWLSTDGGPAEALAPGDVFLILPGEIARYREDPRRPWSYTWLGFDGPRARELLAEAGFIGDVRVRRGIAGPALWRLCDEAEAAFAAEACSPFLAPGLAYRLAEALAPGGSGSPSADPAAALRLVIDAGYDGDLTIGGAAGRLGVDRSTLFRRFRSAYGYGPRAYLRQVRLERARDLLRRGGGTVTAIAEACGYDDHRAFARAYKGRYGVNPSGERRGR